VIEAAYLVNWTLWSTGSITEGSRGHHNNPCGLISNYCVIEKENGEGLSAVSRIGMNSLTVISLHRAFM